MSQQRSITTISSKHQITLPASMCRALGLKKGDQLTATLVDNQILLEPRPRSYVEHYRGRLKGLYGSEQEIEEYLVEERATWHREPAE